MHRRIATTTAALTVAAATLAAAPAIASPAPGAAVVTKSYSKSTVAKHNKASNCWTIIGKNVYNLTPYVKKHPGGVSRIVRICGKNGASLFRGQHGTGGKANQVLKAYKIGTVK